MGDKTIVRARILNTPSEGELNEALKKLDKHYILSVEYMHEGQVLITYSVKVQRNKDDEGDE